MTIPGGVLEAYTFNSVNKLAAYDSGDGTVATYHYDALGRRIAKTVDRAATAYVYDAWNPYSSVANDILLEYSDGVLVRRWLHGSKVDEPLAFEAYSGTTGAGTGAINEVFADRQGSILAVIDHDWEDEVRGPARPSTPEEIEQTGGVRDANWC